MRAAPAPRVHLFVCANRRQGSPLGPGCGDHGDAVYDALKREVGARRLVNEAWITKTHCLGICPKSGATVASYGAAPSDARASAVQCEVEPRDAGALLDEALARAVTTKSNEARAALDAVERELDAIEDLQRTKVLNLARRIKPGLTLEDIQNPHDFPELDDPDWHYADGILTGIQSVSSALRAMRKREGD